MSKVVVSVRLVDAMGAMEVLGDKQDSSARPFPISLHQFVINQL
jgi:hypothetical protein